MKKLLFILIIFSLSACNNSKKERSKPNPNIAPKYAIKEEPKFIDEGDLYFLTDAKDTIASIEIEIADTYESREQGLMHRKSMQENHGMLFIFDTEERQSFWMKNTNIPLDLIFVNNDLHIVHIVKNCQPYSLKAIPSFEYARYVVEVNAGYCNEKGILVGSYIDFSKE
ncbi:MAG: DUF192 domain-containing protein [Salinivirgaceae bacterium]|nr:DUF192 domain-containing protein [Salinivirgaceae bacterium]